MIDLSIARNGQLGEEVRFSDLFAAATFGRFTGGFLVRAPKDGALFFRGGVPVHAGGVAFERHFLGEMLMELGLITQSQLVAALDRQNASEGARPLLGAILVAEAGLEPSKVKEAVSKQIEQRVLGLFGVAEGSWQSAPGENARIREIGVPCMAPGLLVRGLLAHATDSELRAASDLLLGKAVQLSGALPPLDLGPNEQKVVRYLEKPRKPDQLERAVDRRTVRVVLRLLLLLDKAKLLPAGQGIPIPKATLLKAQIPGMAQVPDPEPTPPPVTPDPAPRPRQQSTSRAEHALVAEARAFHAEMGEKNYFELLGVKEETPIADVKKAFHALAKKFHPDAVSGGMTEEVERIMREISAKLNDANQALTNDKPRAEYMALLADDRIKGDSRKAEKIRDAEVKHQMGLVMLKKRDYQKAREYFHYSTQADPDTGEYKASLAWAMFADSKFDRNEALTKGYALILEALKGKKPSAATHFYAGQILKAKNQNKEALHHFKRAQALDPRNADAQREVRLLESRMQKDDDDDGGGNPLKRLFKR